MDSNEAVKQADIDAAKEILTKQGTKLLERETNAELPEVINVSDLSEETKGVLQFFGLEAPNLLNSYCTSLEDALIEQVSKVQTLGKALVDTEVEYKKLNLECCLLKRRLKTIQELLSSKQLGSISELLEKPLN